MYLNVALSANLFLSTEIGATRSIGDGVINILWHPVARHECEKMNIEQIDAKRDGDNGRS